jgi:hypothetical protein
MNKVEIEPRIYGKLVRIALEDGPKRATAYLTSRLVAKATVRGNPRRNASSRSVLVTVGAPNVHEQKFIRQCLRAGEPFPVRKIQLKWPVSRTRKSHKR